MSTRVDMFPQEYTDKLQMLQDSLDPIPTDLVKGKSPFGEGTDFTLPWFFKIIWTLFAL